MVIAKLREKEPFTCLIFCRHGETDYPEDRFYPSVSEGELEKKPALNPEGLMQAQRLGKYFAELRALDAIYTSPTVRTRQTMEPIAQGREISMAVLPELMERRMGQWDGRSAEEIQREDPEGWKRWKTEPLTFSPPGGESLRDFSHRVVKAVGSILDKETGGTVAVVTHGGPIRVATAEALGIPLENCKRLVVAPGSITRIHYTKSWPNLILFGYQP